MNVQEARFRASVADQSSEQFLLDRSSLLQRTRVVATAAAAEAEAVDREARFPKAAIDAARQQKLLGSQIAPRFGGDGASIFDVTDMCYTLGRACASTAMIFAMHQTKVACLVRHGTGSGWHETLMRRVATEQLLLASSTTEGQNGGNVRSSAAAVERTGTGISLVRNATVISYGARPTASSPLPAAPAMPPPPTRCWWPSPGMTTRWNAVWNGKRSGCAEPAARDSN